jgi:hypothetical protein
MRVRWRSRRGRRSLCATKRRRTNQWKTKTMRNRHGTSGWLDDRECPRGSVRHETNAGRRRPPAAIKRPDSTAVLAPADGDNEATPNKIQPQSRARRPASRRTAVPRRSRRRAYPRHLRIVRPRIHGPSYSTPAPTFRGQRRCELAEPRGASRAPRGSRRKASMPAPMPHTSRQGRGAKGLAACYDAKSRG